MENLRDEIDKAIGLLYTVKGPIEELTKLLPEGDSYPVGFEKDEERAANIEAWLDTNEKAITKKLQEVIYSSLRTIKGIIYLKALFYVLNFRLYKQEVIEKNKSLLKGEKKNDLKYSVTCRLNSWGVTIPWRKLTTGWSAKGKPLGVRGTYLPYVKETFAQRASDFSGAGEHKSTLLNNFDAPFARCRQLSATLNEIAKLVKQVATENE